MLVLAHADALGIDLHQLGQRVLQPPRDAHGAAQADVQVRQFFARKFAGAVDRSAGFADHHLVQLDVGRERRDALDEITRQLIRLPAGRAVADGDQVHTMRGDQPAQRVQRTFPVLARLVRVDSVGVQHLAGVTDHRHFHPRANARVQTHHHALARGRRQQQVAQVVGKDLDGHGFGFFAQAAEEVALQAEAELDLPGPGNSLADQVIAFARGVAPGQVARDAAFSQTELARGDLFIQHQLRIQPLQRAPAKDGQRAMAGHRAQGLGIVEVVAELGCVGEVAVLAIHQLALKQALGPQPLTQLANQHGIFGPAFAEQVAHAVQHRGRIGKTGVGVDEGSGLGRRVQRRIREQRVGQRLQSGLARDQALGAALGLEGQIQVFKLLLGGRGLDGTTQFGRQLALLFDALEHRGAAVCQFAQVAEAGFQFAQLDVVQPVGGFLAVAGDEGHRGAAVQQLDGGLDLCRPNLQLSGDLQNDLVQGNGAWLGRLKTGARSLATTMPHAPCPTPAGEPTHGRFTANGQRRRAADSRHQQRP